jgi:hypothetical protein
MTTRRSLSDDGRRVGGCPQDRAASGMLGSTSGALDQAQGPEHPDQCLSSSGTLPPFSASFCITCLCNQMFIEAESDVSPV